MAVVYAYRKEYDEILGVYRRLLQEKELSPVVRADVLLNIGKLYYIREDIDTATDYARQSLEIHDGSEVNMFLAYMYARQGMGASLGERHAMEAHGLLQSDGDFCNLLAYYIIMQLINQQFDNALLFYNENKDKIKGGCESCNYILTRYLVDNK